ncbi:hypothetical protein TeGR_g8761 [Tetraparma gracilis]|uniref:START domain-containing protein n=1 Tax=Tetraparma gracilis TaxID=2962635 RepID=A0ABQ6MEV2_9STRA|nr:hypothetical protein TeGR_g8761 [Tetraparma gracilis]
MPTPESAHAAANATFATGTGPIGNSQKLDTATRSHHVGETLTKEASILIHTDPPTLLNALMNLSRAYQGQPPPARDPDSPGLPPPTRELVTRSVKGARAITSSVRLGLGGKTNFSHDFEVMAVSPLSVCFRRHPDAAPAPHDASGTLTMVGAEHNTTRLSMAAQMAAAGEGAPSSTNVPASKEAHALLDNLLQLLPALFAMFNRSGEVDEAVLGQLTERFLTASTQPSADEAALLDKARAYNDKAWKRLKGSVWEPVEKWRASAGETSAWGKAVGSVDAAAARVLAYLWYYESYERKNKNNADLIRLGIEIPNSHSMFQLVELNIGAGQKRFYASKWTWCRESSGDFIAALTSVQDLPEGEEKAAILTTIEKNKSSDAVIVSQSRGLYRISSLAENVCRVTLVAQGTIGGWVPDQAMKFLIRSTLGIVEDTRDKYERNGKVVDAELRSEFPPPPLLDQLNGEQMRIAQKCLAMETGSAGVEWTPLKSTSPFVAFSMQYTKPERNQPSVALGMAKATLDCSATEAFAYQFAVCGREKMRISKEGEDLARFVLKERAAHDFELASVKKMPFPLTNREFLTRYLSFKEPTGDLVVVFEALPDTTKVDYGANLKVVRAKSTGIVRFKPINGDAQCEVTQIQHGEFGGLVSDRVVVAKIPQAVRGVSVMRERFQRDDEVDGAKRSELAGIIESNNEIYTDVENSVVDRVRDQLDSIPDSSFEKLESPDHLVHMEGFHKGGKNGVPRASTVVDEDICTYVSKMRKRFDKSPAIDLASSLRLVAMIQNHDAPYTEKEEEILRTGVSHISMFEAQKGTELKMASPSTKAKIAYEKGSSFAFGYATTTVRASPEEVLADQWDLLNRAGRAADDLEKCVDEEPSGHNKLIYIRKKTPDAFDNRDFLSRVIWMATPSGFVNVTNAEESARRPHLKGVVRGKYPSILKVTAAGNGQTKLEYVIQPDFGGSMPAWAMKFYMSSNLSEVTKIQVTMQARRGLENWDDEDGKATAEILVTKTDAEKHHGREESEVEARVRAIMETHEGLRELGEKHGWFEVLLTKVVANKLRPAGDSRAKLCNMSEKEAKVIGGALASCIAANLTASAAVDEWMLRYPAMGELEREYVWFRPMMDTIAQRLLESVSWGLKMRLYVGASLSTMDLLSDLYMIYTAATISFDFDIMALAASLVSTHVYYASDPDEPVMEEGLAWTIMGSLSASWLSFFAAFLLLMKRPYLVTFFSTQTGYQYVQSKFLREGDENKKAVFKYNKKQWLSIRADVKAWTTENWELWEEEQPSWFNENFKASVDDDMIPAESLRKMNGGSQRRRSSLGDLLGAGAGGAKVAPVGGGGGDE